MPIDPSIVSNAFVNAANNMPDMNALMQQRVQGAENVYKIETARQEQAAEAEKEAAKQAAEAMLPAVASAFSDPSDAGLDAATAMLPPEVAQAFTPFMQRLKGIADPKMRMTILRAELAKDEEGKFILSQLEPSANMVLQAKTAERRAAIDERQIKLAEQKAKLDALGQGDWNLQEAEDGFFWVNPRSRQVIPADVTGGAAPGAVPSPAPIPAPDVVTPRQPVPGAPAAVVPGTAQAPAFRPKAKEGKEDDLTEGEGKAVNFTLRMADSDAITNELEAAGVVTTDAVTNFFLGAVQSLPLSAGANLASQLESAFNATLPTLSPEEQRLARAQLDFVTAILRSESGAEIKTSEFPAEYRKYFPTEGDEGNEKLLADKRRARKLAIKGMRAKAGKRGQADIDNILAEESAGGRTPAAPPVAPGATVDGFEYQGVEE